MPKAHTKTASIEISCSPEEKEQLRQNATRAGTSVSRYLVTLGLNGNTTDYGTLRRKADGALVNAELYQRLGEMVTALQASPDFSWSLVAGSDRPDPRTAARDCLESLAELR